MDMPTKGKKSTKGEGDIYNEPKRNTILVLTDTAKANLDAKADEFGLSRSELVERFARGILEMPNELTEEDKQELGEA